jgi:cytochrome c-type biogenesis protein CcmH/NrfF
VRLVTRRILHSVLLVVALAWLFLAAAVIAGASHAAAATTEDAAPKLEQRSAHPRTSLDAVSSTVMCPTCDTTLDRSNSPAAEQMRSWIRAAVAAGWTKDQIRDGLVTEYGGDESILATPRAQGVGALAWYVPVGIVVLLAATGIVLVRRWRRPATNSTAQPGTAQA